MPNSESFKVAVLGLGLMGTAIARAVLNAGFSVNLWNRTRDKCLPLEANGIKIFDLSQDAIACSNVVIIVLPDYAISIQVIGDVDLTGKTVVQVATGSVNDAISMDRFCLDRRAQAYIEVKAMTFPGDIGTAAGFLLASGNLDAFEEMQPVLASLGECRHVGENIAGASSVGLAWSIHYQITLAGLLETINAAEALGLEPEVVFEIANRLGTERDGVVSRWREAARRPQPPQPATAGTLTSYLEALDCIFDATDGVGAQLPIAKAVRKNFGGWAEQGLGYADIEDAFEASRLSSTLYD